MLLRERQKHLGQLILSRVFFCRLRSKSLWQAGDAPPARSAPDDIIGSRESMRLLIPPGRRIAICHKKFWSARLGEGPFVSSVCRWLFLPRPRPGWSLPARSFRPSKRFTNRTSASTAASLPATRSKAAKRALPEDRQPAHMSWGNCGSRRASSRPRRMAIISSRFCPKAATSSSAFPAAIPTSNANTS